MLANTLIMASPSSVLWLAGERLGVTLGGNTGELSQCGGLEQEQVRPRFSPCPSGRRDRQIGPPPGHRHEDSRATPQRNPRRALTPEDLTHSPRRAAVRALL